MIDTMAWLAAGALMAAGAPAPQDSAGAIWTQPAGSDRDDKYFAFHKAGVPAEKARADLAECLQYAANIQAFVGPPRFVLLGEPAEQRSTLASAPFGGIAGTLIVGLIARGFNNGIGRGNLRRCMFYKNYRRYAVSREAWAGLNKGSDEQVAARLAALAAGDAPQVRALEP